MEGLVVRVPLSRGLFALVSECDAARVNEHRWQANPALSKTGEQIGWYAVTRISGKTVYMHRFILGVARGEQADHQDRDGLNNTRRNLRRCTQSLNNANRRMKNASGFRGVYAHGYQWRAAIGQNEYLGRFQTKEEAARAYDREARIRWGEFATLNFPQEAAA